MGAETAFVAWLDRGISDASFASDYPEVDFQRTRWAASTYPDLVEQVVQEPFARTWEPTGRTWSAPDEGPEETAAPVPAPVPAPPHARSHRSPDQERTLGRTMVPEQAGRTMVPDVEDEEIVIASGPEAEVEEAAWISGEIPWPDDVPYVYNTGPAPLLHRWNLPDGSIFGISPLNGHPKYHDVKITKWRHADDADPATVQVLESEDLALRHCEEILGLGVVRLED